MGPALETVVVGRLDRLRQGLVESDVLVRLLRSQIVQLNSDNDASELQEEERRLRRENAQLCVRVETLRARLVSSAGRTAVEEARTDELAPETAVEPTPERILCQSTANDGGVTGKKQDKKKKEKKVEETKSAAGNTFLFFLHLFLHATDKSLFSNVL